MEGPFISKQAEYIYYLTELDGKTRNNKLGLTDIHYESKKEAKKWYKNIARLVHPDKLKLKNDIPFKVLRKIYEIITNDEDKAEENKNEEK